LAIVVITRWKGDYQQALAIGREAARDPEAAWRHVLSVRPVLCRPDTCLLFAETTYPDWATYGRAQQALAADAEWQRVFGEAIKPPNCATAQ